MAVDVMLFATDRNCMDMLCRLERRIDHIQVSTNSFDLVLIRHISNDHHHLVPGPLTPISARIFRVVAGIDSGPGLILLTQVE